ELDAEELLEQRGESERADSEQLRGNARVEQTAGVPAVVLEQQAKVVIGVVKDGFRARALQQLAKRARFPDRQRIENGVHGFRAYLEEVDSVDESVETGALGVDGHAVGFADRGEKALGVSRAIDVPCGGPGRARGRSRVGRR